MASSRPWRWLVLLTSGGLFGFAVLAAQASGGDTPVDPVEAIETPLPSRAAPVIPDADPSDMAAPDPAVEDGQPESFHARGHTRARRSGPTNRSKPKDWNAIIEHNNAKHRFSASKSGIFPSQIFEPEDDDNDDDAPVAQQANPAPR